MLTALSGGGGGPRMLAGAVDVVAPRDITVIVNTGDDTVLHGLHISPDADSVVYTLAGAINPDTGWGLAGETWRVMESLERYGGETWFRLGDRDLATHLHRTHRLRAGATLSQVTAEIAAAWGVDVRLLPMADGRVETRITIAGEGEVPFQEYFVGRRHAVSVSDVRFDGANGATPAPGVLEAIAGADVVVVCPSNPIVSIGPILAVPGVRDALGARRDQAVAVSPIVAGAAIKGPAARMLAELGHEPSVVGIARIYADLVATLVVDEADAALAPRVEAEGVRCVVAPTVMHGRADAASLTKTVIEAAT